MARNLVFMLVASSVMAVGTPSVRPQAKPAPVFPTRQDVDENLFLFYVLEDLYKSFWLAADPPTAVRDAKAKQATPTRDTSPVTFGVVVARQRLVVNQVLRHLEKQKSDDRIVKLFADYNQLLDEANKTADEVAEVLVKCATFVRANDVKRANAALLAGFGVGLQTYVDDKRSGDEAVIAGLLSGYGKLLESMPAAAKDRETARNAFKAQSVKLVESFVRRFRPLRANFLRDARTAAGAMAKERNQVLQQELTDQAERQQRELEKAGESERTAIAKRHKARREYLEADIEKKKWKPSEIQISDLVSESRRPRDPFLFLRNTRGTPADDRKELAAIAATADACFDAVRLVPAGKVYNVFRAQLLSAAGLYANRAAALDLGTSGFPAGPSNAAKGSARAVQAWQFYLKFEPLDTNITLDVLHQVALAYAYAGRTRDAYNHLLRVDSGKLRGGTPAFWYDAARVCSMAHDLKRARYCLNMAVRTGFRDFEGAKVIPDLQYLRKNDRDGWFQRTVGGR